VLAAYLAAGCPEGSLAQPTGRQERHECTWQINRVESGTVLNGVEFLSSSDALGYDDRCIWRTEDGGKHWARVHCTAQDGLENRIQALQYPSLTEGWALVGTNGLLHSADAGRSWTAQTFDGKILYGLRFADRKRGWIAGEQRTGNRLESSGLLLATDDGGKNWVEVRLGAGKPFAWRLLGVWPISPANVWAVGDLLLHSEDGGKSWREAGAGSELDRLRNVSIQFANPNLGWIRRLPPDNFLVTMDGGKTWAVRRPPTKPPFIDDLVYLNAQVAWLAAGSIYRSGDSGISWRVVLGRDKGSAEEPRYHFLQLLDRLLIAAGDDRVAVCRLE
jgi:photosystem II stability/assembly factor-like uncharacterized protein